MASSKLTAKAAKLDFSHLPGALQPPVTTQGDAAAAQPPSPAPLLDLTVRPKTAPGAMMAFATDARSELLRENDSLRARAGQAQALQGRLDEALGDLRQWEGAKAARLIDAKLVTASRFANRHAVNYAGPEFAALRAEIESAGGNVQPIKVRSLAASAAAASAPGEPVEATPRYELVFGHRRHRACLELGLPVLAVIDNLGDRTLFVEMDRENRARKDLSAWEQGMMYRRALQQGLFPSNRKLAEAIGVDLSALGKALALAELPEPVVQAFGSPLALQFRWARPLSQALAARSDAVLACAKEWATRPADRTPKAVFDSLMAAAGQGVEPFHPTMTAARSVALQVGGEPVGSVVFGAKGDVTVAIAAGLVPHQRLAALAKLVEGFLKAPAAKGP